MTLHARIKRASTLWHRLRSARAPHGSVMNVIFRWTGIDYETSVLSDNEAALLARSPAIDIIGTSNPPADIVDVLSEPLVNRQRRQSSPSRVRTP